MDQNRNTEIRTLLPELILPRINSAQPSEEVSHDDIMTVIDSLRPEYPWLETEDFLATDGTLTLYFASKRDEVERSGIINYYPFLIVGNEEEDQRYESMHFIKPLYLVVKDYAIGVSTFCEIENINPGAIKARGKESREQIFLETLAETENIALALTQRRWEMEASLFGEPLHIEPTPTRIFTVADTPEGLMFRTPFSDNRLLVIVNPKKIVDSLFFYESYNQEVKKFKTINAIGEALAHERQHHNTNAYRHARESFDFEEVFVEITSIIWPRNLKQEVITYQSIYWKGAERLNKMANEILLTSGTDNKKKSLTKEIQRSIHATAHTGQLYGEYKVGNNNILVTGFATLYEKTTGKNFASEMSAFSDTEYRNYRLYLATQAKTGQKSVPKE